MTNMLVRWGIGDFKKSWRDPSNGGLDTPLWAMDRINKGMYHGRKMNLHTHIKQFLQQTIFSLVSGQYFVYVEYTICCTQHNACNQETFTGTNLEYQGSI